MRDLASICTIDKVWSLEGKDRVQGCSMVENGFEAMVSKDITPGMLVCFIQEGAILPVVDAWEWLRKRCYKESVNGFVIKPLKFSSIKSWGVVIPLSDLPLSKQEVAVLKAGDDVTDALNIRKYEPEEDASPSQKNNSSKAYPAWVKFCLSKSWLLWIGRIWQKFNVKAALQFPSKYIEKSDETAVQNMKSVLDKFKDSTVYVTQKLEGQSCVSSDTLVETENGLKTIKELVDSSFKGRVWSLNDLNEKELKEVESVHCLDNDENTFWYELKTEDGRILKITGNDMVYLPKLRCYRRVDELVGNEELLIND